MVLSTLDGILCSKTVRYIRLVATDECRTYFRIFSFVARSRSNVIPERRYVPRGDVLRPGTLSGVARGAREYL